MAGAMADQAAAGSRWSDLAVRSASGLIMAATAFAFIRIGGWPFTIMCLILGGLIFWEWQKITRQTPASISWLIAGILYAILPVAALIYLRNGTHGFTVIPSNAPQFAIVLAVVAAVIATDVGAYFAGRILGGPKLAPRISPKKTWAGFFGGILSAILVIAALQYFLPQVSHEFPPEPNATDAASDFAWNAVLFSAPVSVVSQVGDLFESWLKRRFDVKDSSHIIPGHGGVMDRLDGLIAASVFVAGIIYFWSAS